MNQHRGLVVLVLLFLLLSAIYNVSIPLYEAPDENDHFRYVVMLQEEKRLPHILSDLATYGHEIFQPPLYYLLMSPIVSAVGTEDLSEIAPLNKDWFSGAGINVHYHTKAETFPYQSTTLAVHIIRFVSSIFACITIISTYGIAQSIIPKQALLAAAIVAFNPMFVFLSSVVNNDTLVIALSTLTLWWLIRLLFLPSIKNWQYVLLGFLWGLTIISKTSGLAMGGIIVLGLVFVAWRYHSWKSTIIGLLLVFFGASLSSGWFFVRNVMLYGDFLAWDAVLVANKGLLRSSPLPLIDMYYYAGGILDSYWGSFGYGGLKAPASYYILVNVLVLSSFVGVGIWIYRNSVQKPLPMQLFSVVLLIVWNGLLLISLTQWMSLLVATNRGRLIFPGIGALAVLIALGFSALLKGKRNWIGIGFVVLLGIFAIYAPFFLIKPAYAQPTTVIADVEIPNSSNVRFGEHIELLGFQLSQNRVNVGESLEIDLFWDTDEVLSENYVIALHTLDASGEVVSRMDVLPYNGRYATPVWQPNFPFKDTHVIPHISQDAVAGLGHIIVTLYPWGMQEKALPISVNDIPVGKVLTVAPIKISLTESIVYDPENEKIAILGDKVKLFGFDMPQTTDNGESFPITLYWEAFQPDGIDYTVFVHMINDNGQLVAQADSPPQNNQFPTSIWEAGEQIEDKHELIWPQDLQPGTYEIVIGMYNPTTGHRLTAVNQDGTVLQENSVTLTTINID